MRETSEDRQPGERLTRRGLLAAGGVGVAALWIGPEWTVLDGVAEAATRNVELRRSGWLQVTDPAVRATVGGRTAGLRLVGVDDLPVAAGNAELRDHDAAFAVRFSGPPGLEQGTWSLSHAELGTFALFVVPVERVDGDRQLYEAVVDRTVQIAGITDDPVPPAEQVVVAAERAFAPAPVPGAIVPPAAVGGTVSARAVRTPARRRPAKPRVRRVALSRGSGRRTVVAEISWADAQTVKRVHGLLVSRGRVVARAGGSVRRLARLRMRLKAHRNVPAGRYELRLTVVERSGRVTRIRRTVRVR